MTELPPVEASRTIWGVTSFDCGGNAGYIVHALFTTEAETHTFASRSTVAMSDCGFEVEPFTLQALGLDEVVLDETSPATGPHPEPVQP